VLSIEAFDSSNLFRQPGTGPSEQRPARVADAPATPAAASGSSTRARDSAKPPFAGDWPNSYARRRKGLFPSTNCLRARSCAWLPPLACPDCPTNISNRSPWLQELHVRTEKLPRQPLRISSPQSTISASTSMNVGASRWVRCTISTGPHDKLCDAR
jgi:hypothetical protein